MVRDYRDGRFFLDHVASGAERGTAFTELAVCDPLSRRYVLLPPIPEDLAGTVDGALNVLGGRRACEPFLAPAEPCEPDTERPPFTVLDGPVPAEGCRLRLFLARRAVQPVSGQGVAPRPCRAFLPSMALCGPARG